MAEIALQRGHRRRRRPTRRVVFTHAARDDAAAADDAGRVLRGDRPARTGPDPLRRDIVPVTTDQSGQILDQGRSTASGTGPTAEPSPPGVPTANGPAVRSPPPVRCAPLPPLGTRRTHLLANGVHLCRRHHVVPAPTPRLALHLRPSTLPRVPSRRHRSPPRRLARTPRRRLDMNVADGVPVPSRPRVRSPYRYTSSDEDSGRWDGFELRDGDIVISTRTKHGTTWMQNIVALLIFGTPELPAPIADLSPWLDWTVRPRDEVVAAPRRADAPPVHQDPHAARRHPARRSGHLHRRGAPPARRRGVAVPPAAEPRPVAVGRAHRERAARSGQVDRRRCTTASWPGSTWTSTHGSTSTASTASARTWPTRGRAGTSRTSCSCTTTTCSGPRRLDARARRPARHRGRRGGVADARRRRGVRRRCGPRAADAVPERDGVIRDPERFFRRGCPARGSRSSAGRDRRVRSAHGRARPARPARLAAPLTGVQASDGSGWSVPSAGSSPFWSST